ncbi:F-box protein [Aspergillus stella-maris]|uniref:F-box protein n=1 Tax=Aspergillus stella-maris TaxID=1810926 RepID=UPI003CCD7501
MLHLLNLPDEILLLILSNFAGHYMFKEELLALCLVSKRFCSVAQPFLYNQYVREVHCQCCHTHAAPPGRLVPLILFTRTLISRPDLAARVQTAKFDLAMDEFDDDDVREAELDADTFKVLSGGFLKLPVEFRADNFSDAVSMCSNPWLLVLAAHLPNLQNLQLTIAEDGLRDLDPLFAKLPCLGVEQPYFKSLKSIVIRDLAQSKNEYLTIVNSVLKLPQLEDFTWINVNGDAYGCPLLGFEPKSLNISKLSLFEACINTERLEALIKGCKCLKEFNYRGNNFYAHDILESCQFKPEHLLTILDSQKVSLHTIRCNLDWDELESSASKCWPKYGSFKSFTSLRHLSLDQYPYAPNTELPTSLHCLTIANIGFPIFDVVRSLQVRKSNGPGSDVHNILPDFKCLILVPRGDNPTGMLDVEEKYDWDGNCDEVKKLDEFDLACDTLWQISRECRFSVDVMHEVWDLFWESREEVD